VAKTPLGGAKTAGIFSLAFADEKHGVAVGGDYKNSKAAGNTVAVTRDGGKTWRAPGKTAMSYRSGVAALGGGMLIAVGVEGADVSRDGGETWQHFSDTSSNAVAGKAGAVWAVGPKGAVVKMAQAR
jgi:hypothetical protein